MRGQGLRGGCRSGEHIHLEREKIARESREVWDMMAHDDQSCFRHIKASRDLSKTAQPCRTQLKTDLCATKIHLQD